MHHDELTNLERAEVLTAALPYIRQYSGRVVAVKYGGGGHPRASGAAVRDKEEAMAMLRDLDELAGEAEKE